MPDVSFDRSCRNTCVAGQMATALVQLARRASLWYRGGGERSCLVRKGDRQPKVQVAWLVSDRHAQPAHRTCRGVLNPDHEIHLVQERFILSERQGDPLPGSRDLRAMDDRHRSFIGMHSHDQQICHRTLRSRRSAHPSTLFGLPSLGQKLGRPQKLEVADVHGINA
jgi:hypothetical protein